MPRIAIGKDLYVFTSGNGNSECVIDSHGFRPPTKPHFTTAAEVKFYVNRHAFLCVAEIQKNKPGGGHYHYVSSVLDIGQRSVPVVEAINQNDQCPDYLLSKQAKPDSGIALNRYDHVGYSDIEAFASSALFSSSKMDIVSVRNRSGRLVYLSDVVGLLHHSGYAVIHCSFCRGGVMDAFKDLFGRGRNEIAGGQKL